MTEEEDALQKWKEGLEQFIDRMFVKWELSQADKRFLRALRISPK